VDRKDKDGEAGLPHPPPGYKSADAAGPAGPGRLRHLVRIAPQGIGVRCLVGDALLGLLNRRLGGLLYFAALPQGCILCSFLHLLAALAENPAFAGDFAELQVDRVKLDGNPRWRGTATFGWRLGDFSMGGSVRYVSDMIDTSADITVDGETVYWKVKEDWRVNLYGEYRFRLGDRRNVRLRLGVNNVFDSAPPLVDESYGYYPEYHSVKPREFYVQLRGSF